MAGRHDSDEHTRPGSDRDDWDGVSIVFDLGGRLDLPEGFAVPPLRLATPDELVAAAREAPAMVRLAAFLDWVGKGRRLDDDAELEASEQEDLGAHLGLEPEQWLDADDDIVTGPYQAQASLLTEWAALAGVVHQRGHKLLPTAAGRKLHRDPLAAWTSAFEAVLELGVVDLGGNGPPWGQTVDAVIPDVIVLANTSRAPVRFSDLVRKLCSDEQELLDFASDDGTDVSGLRGAIAEDTRAMVDKLVELGVVALDGDAMRATPLGTWAALHLLEADGFDVPLIE